MEVEVEEIVEESEDFSISIDTKGLCLLCLIKVEPESEQSRSTSSLSAESFQCLSRYLEVDLCKILNVRQAARAKKMKMTEGLGFEGPQLKVKLCERCTLITKKFSELCEQLTDCLKIIRKKLVDAEETGLVHLLGKTEDEVKPRTRSGRKKKLGTAEGLRNEIIERCSDKLSMWLPPRPCPRQDQHMTPRSVEPPEPESDPLLESLPGGSSKTPQEDIGIGELSNVKVNADAGLIEDDDKCDDENDLNDNVDDDDEDWNQNSELCDDSRQSNDLSSTSSSGIDNDDDHDIEEEGDPEEDDLETIKSASSSSNLVKKPKQGRKPSVITINPESGKHQCSICLKEFGSRKGADVHYKSIHLKIRYKCKACEKDFGYKRTLRYHVRDKHSGMSAPIKCSKCSETFTQKSDLKEHKQTSSCCTKIRAKRIYSCDTCKKTFNHPSRLKHHMDTVHLKLRNHVCDQCGKGFSTPDHLRRHVNSIHLNLREHLCAGCGKGFKRANELTMHVKSVHLKEKDHVCDQCGKGFPISNSLRKHIQQVHLRIRDYACDLCEEKFHSKHQLNSHRIRVHLERKKRKWAYVSIKNRCRCTLCGKGFTRNNDLKRHVERVHLQLREYVCELCQVTFKQKTSLDLHRSKFHSETGNGSVTVTKRRLLRQSPT